jgi:hypothetical protein
MAHEMAKRNENKNNNKMPGAEQRFITAEKYENLVVR